IRAGKAAGLYTVGALVFSLSPVHTDQLFADKTRGLVALGVDAILLKDSAGLLTPERVKTLLPAMQAALGGRPLEIHSHCTTGLAPIVYAEALKLGVDAVHTAISPLANRPRRRPHARGRCRSPAVSAARHWPTAAADRADRRFRGASRPPLSRRRRGPGRDGDLLP